MNISSSNTRLWTLPYFKYVLFAWIFGWEKNFLVCRWVSTRKSDRPASLHFGEATEHISLEGDQFKQHFFKLPGFKPTDLKTALSFLTALWTSQLCLGNWDFPILLIFDRVLENAVFSPGLWFWTKSKSEVRFCPRPFSFAVEFMLLQRFTLEKKITFRILNRIWGAKNYTHKRQENTPSQTFTGS